MISEHGNTAFSASCYRIVSIVRLPASAGKGIYNEAHLRCGGAEFRVYWHSTVVDAHLQRGCMVILLGEQEPKELMAGQLLHVEGLMRADKLVIFPENSWKSICCIAIYD